MEQIRKWIRENDWKSMGIIAYYGYFAVNVLVKAFGYDSSDQIYKFFMLSGVILLGMKLVNQIYAAGDRCDRADARCRSFHMGNDQKGDDTVFVFNDHRNQGCVFPEID